jgi:DNA-binding LacI/PurR family transcriptional regulator
MHGSAWRGQCAVSGWDDTPVSRFIDLTTVAMPTHDLGRQAAECLLERLADRTAPNAQPRHLELPARVLLRSSTHRQPDGATP